MINKSFEKLDRDTLPKLFTTLVRLHLEYGNDVWGPFYKLDQKAVEQVQKRATRMIPDLHGLPYAERVGRLRLPTLHYRRRIGDMIQVYKIVQGLE